MRVIRMVLGMLTDCMCPVMLDSLQPFASIARTIGGICSIDSIRFDSILFFGGRDEGMIGSIEKNHSLVTSFVDLVTNVAS